MNNLYDARFPQVRVIPDPAEKGLEDLFSNFQVWLGFNSATFSVIKAKSKAHGDVLEIETPAGRVIAKPGDLVAFDERARPHVYREVTP